MSKAPKLRRNKKAEEVERAAEDITDSYYCLVLLGEEFSDTSGTHVLDDLTRLEAYKDRKLSTKAMLKSTWIDKDDETFFGFWGEAWNRYMDMSLSKQMKFLKRWRLVLYSDEDERYKDEKPEKGVRNKCERLDYEDKVPDYSKRYFMLSENMGNEPYHAAFESREYVEKKGTIMEWHCSKKCLKKKTKVFRPDQLELYDMGGFRFEVEKKTQLAPAIKYIPRGREDPLKTEEIIAENERNPHFDIGDDEDFNIRNPHGYFNFDKGVNPDENALVNKTLTKDLIEKRSGFFRYFNSSAARHSKNRSLYFNPGSGRTHKSIYDQGNVLRHFQSESIYSDQVSARPATLFFHPLSDGPTEDEEADINRRRLQIERDCEKEETQLKQKYSPPLDDDLETETEKKERMETLEKLLIEAKKTKEERLHSLEERKVELELGRVKSTHERVHQQTFIQEIDPRDTGVFTIGVVDPMIHHHDYVTVVKDSTNLSLNEVVAGSDSEFICSMQIRNKVTGDTVVNYFFNPMKPQLRKKKKIDGSYCDSLIYDIHKYSPDHSLNVLPFEGEVSFICECARGKQQFFHRYGHSGRVCRLDHQPWQLFGEFTVRYYKNNKQQQILGAPRSKHLVDYVLFDKDSRVKLTIRTVQYENLKSEIVNVFLDLPITKFQKDPEFDPTKPENFNRPQPKTEFSSRAPRPSTAPTIQSRSALPPSSIEDSTPVNEPVPIPKQHDPKFKPIVNRFLCQDCGALARPRVKMSRLDKKVVKNPLVRYSKWYKNVVKDLAEDGDKSLVILELGAGKVLRKTSDKLLKLTKQYNSKLIRVHPNPPKEKKKKDDELAEKIIEIKKPCSSVINEMNEYIEEMSETLDLYFKD